MKNNNNNYYYTQMKTILVGGLLLFSLLQLLPIMKTLLERNDHGKGIFINIEKIMDAWSSPRANLHILVSIAAYRYDLDPSIIASVIHFESSGDPCAISHASAMGLMQMIPKTAVAMIGDRDPFEPYVNVMGGTKLLSRNIRKYGFVTGLAVYNYGSRAIKRSRSRWPNETQQYVFRISNLYNQLNTQGKDSWKNIIPKWVPKSNFTICSRSLSG